MYDIYSLGEPTRRHRSTKRKMINLAIIVAAVLIVVSGGLYVFEHFLRPNTSISQSKAETSFYNSEPGGTQHIKNNLFAVDIPAGWKPSTNLSLSDTPYDWRGTKKDDVTRSINVYIDNVPTSL